MNIKLFNEVWYDCYSAILNNIIFTLDKERLDVIYNNSYFYKNIRHCRDGAPEFYSINSLSCNQDELQKLLFQSVDVKTFSDEQKLFDNIYDNLKKGKIIVLRVDMYDYLPSINNIYHISHVMHYSLIQKYDEDTETFTMLEENEEIIGKDKLMKACLAGEGKLAIYKLNDPVKLEPLTQDEVIQNARRIIASLDEIFKDFNIWKVENPTKEDIDYMSAAATTHLQSIKCRNHSNGWLLDHVFEDVEIGDLFRAIEYRADVLRSRFLKLSVKYEIEEMNNLREELLKIFEAERETWKKVIARFA